MHCFCDYEALMRWEIRLTKIFSVPLEEHLQNLDLIPHLSMHPDCVAFDIVCGCPGWLQAMILARQYIMSSEAKRILVVGGDTLSRIIDPYDRDSMIYADGARTAVVEGGENHRSKGIMTTSSQTYSVMDAFYLR
jgi:3-oxoacyl-[acyl-carrier-protein] synthase III